MEGGGNKLVSAYFRGWRSALMGVCSGGMAVFALRYDIMIAGNRVDHSPVSDTATPPVNMLPATAGGPGVAGGDRGGTTDTVATTGCAVRRVLFTTVR